jgi:hypothetical protein
MAIVSLACGGLCLSTEFGSLTGQQGLRPLEIWRQDEANRSRLRILKGMAARHKGNHWCEWSGLLGLSIDGQAETETKGKALSSRLGIRDLLDQ